MENLTISKNKCFYLHFPEESNLQKKTFSLNHQGFSNVWQTSRNSNISFHKNTKSFTWNVNSEASKMTNHWINVLRSFFGSKRFRNCSWFHPVHYLTLQNMSIKNHIVNFKKKLIRSILTFCKKISSFSKECLQRMPSVRPKWKGRRFFAIQFWDQNLFNSNVFTVDLQCFTSFCFSDILDQNYSLLEKHLSFVFEIIDVHEKVYLSSQFSKESFV